MKTIKHSGFRNRILSLLGTSLIGILLISHGDRPAAESWPLSVSPDFQWHRDTQPGEAPILTWVDNGPAHARDTNSADFPNQIDPECQTAAVRAERSSGERFTVVTVFYNGDVTHSYPHCCIIDWENDRIKYIDGRLERDRFMGWTVDQHYGVFNTSSHYGVSETMVFDTVQWKIIPEAATESPMPYAMSPWSGGAFAVSPVAHQYVNWRGEIVDIPTGTRTYLRSKEGWSIWGGAWSPDAAYLAYLVMDAINSPGRYILFLAQGDGSQAREVADFMSPSQGYITGWHWSPDGQQFVLTMGESANLQYTFDLVTGRLYQEPSWH